MHWKRPIALTVLLGVMAIATPAVPEVLAAEAGVPSDGTIEFAVFRKGDRIGTHKLTFIEKGDRLEVRVDVSLKVDLLFVTVYRYQHEALEIWDGGRLVSFESSTQQNGKKWEVAAHSGDDSLVVRTNDQQRVLPDTLPPTSYWKRGMLDQPRWFNTQYGSPIDVDVAPLGPEKVEAVGQPVEAHRYKVTGIIAETGKPVDMDLWYDDSGELVKMQFVAVADGSLIEFERIS